MIALRCAHSYCAQCCLNLIKVTKIKKGLVMFNDSDPSQMPLEEPLKCPKCNLVHLVSEEDTKKYEYVLGVEAIRERMLKRNEIKLQSLYKNADSMSAEV